MDVSLVQASNALSPIEVTEREIVMEVNASHSLNTLSVIDVIEPERIRENLQP